LTWIRNDETERFGLNFSRCANRDIGVVLLAGHGGRVTSGMSLSAYVVKNLALEMKDDSHPREAILKHAKVNHKRKHNVR